MKILIMSDTHLLTEFYNIVEMENADINIHLGDSQLLATCAEMEKFDYKVKGNCDYSSYSNELVVNINGDNWLLFHGHQVFATHDPFSIAEYAKEKNCTVVCHGHTHIPVYKNIDGIKVINPGSFARSRCRLPNSYMIITIDNNEWKMQLKNSNTSEIIEEV